VGTSSWRSERRADRDIAEEIPIAITDPQHRIPKGLACDASFEDMPRSRCHRPRRASDERDCPDVGRRRAVSETRSDENVRETIAVHIARGRD
jgi:hypothetical protein